ncbi:hypothetical protein, partial [Mesorhizobium sp. M2E.F.Ca.ET.209.01.1.1]|uniref:hypothetical protein n=1 Tax=Mesorhizobium sp. M2E.F.Ca.ET.209.01.1.1 TaxID=2500526 RepID=UPI001AED85C9
MFLGSGKVAITIQGNDELYLLGRNAAQSGHWVCSRHRAASGWASRWFLPTARLPKISAKNSLR